jgi:putative Holliday junction resolvase
LSETVLAFDVGARRIGVAVGNDLIRQAQRAAVIDADVADGGLAAIAKLVDEWRPERFVVGVPLPESTDGQSKSPALARCERFAVRIGERFHLPVERVDERYSSIEADDVHRERRRAGIARRAKTLDDVAAEIILQRYFDSLPA